MTDTESSLLEVSDAEFESQVLQSDIPVLVDFWAPWCRPCLMLEPTMKKLAEEYEGKVRIVKVNSDEETETAQQCGVRGLPNVMLFVDGKQVMNVVGTQPKSTFQKMLDDALGDIGTDESQEALFAEDGFRMSFLDTADIDELLDTLKKLPWIGQRPFADGMTPIEHTMMRSMKDRIQAVLTAKPDLTIREHAGLGDLQEVEAILADHPDQLDQPGTNGRRPLDVAAAHNQFDVVQFLLRKGADVGTPAKAGEHLVWPPLVSAISRGNLKMFDLLVDHGADINAVNAMGASMLHVATMQSLSAIGEADDILAKLLSLGANKDAKDKDGHTPLEAVHAYAERMKKHMAEHGGDVDGFMKRLEKVEQAFS